MNGVAYRLRGLTKFDKILDRIKLSHEIFIVMKNIV